MKKTTETPDGKVITKTEREDGSKDVAIEVQSLDVDLSDPENAAAKKEIEEKVLPAIADAQITCTLIHKPTNDHASFVCARKSVAANAEVFVKKHAGVFSPHVLKDYCLVENDGNGNISVTSL